MNDAIRSRLVARWSLSAAFVLLPLLALSQSSTDSVARASLGVAEFTASGQLRFPENADQWIAMGASVGTDYSEEPLDSANPPPIGVVQMEPSAYRYFVENGRYANGTMFLLSFFAPEQNTEPKLRGFVQGALRGREIHLIDRERYADTHAFFLFPGDVSEATMVPAGNECIVCHSEHGAFDGTFTQFYPPTRGLSLEGRD